MQRSSKSVHLRKFMSSCYKKLRFKFAFMLDCDMAAFS